MNRLFVSQYAKCRKLLSAKYGMFSQARASAPHFGNQVQQPLNEYVSYLSLLILGMKMRLELWSKIYLHCVFGTSEWPPFEARNWGILSQPTAF